MVGRVFGSPLYRVLIIEDEPALRGRVANILREASMEVIESPTIQDALSRVKSNQPQLILISDTLLHAQSGELGRLFREEASPRHPLIVLLGTSETSSETQAGGLECGADSYILRSIPMREFVARIEALANLQSIEERASYLNRVLRAIRNINQLIVREKNRQRLLQKTCQILTESGNYFTAWVVTFSHHGKVEIVAASGLGEAFEEMHQQLLRGQLSSVERQALQQTEAVLIEDLHSLGSDYPWLPQNQGQAAMSVSLRYGERVYGVLTVCLPKEFIGEAEECFLIEEVASDLAFALHNLDLEDRQAKIAADLRESEEKYRLLSETTPDIILVHDMQGLIQYVNQAGLDFAGFTAEQVIGRRITDFIPAEYLSEINKRREERLSGDLQTFQYEIEFMNRFGKRVPMEVYSTPFQREGKAGEVLIVARNITKRKAAERQVQESRRQLATLINNLPGIAYRCKNDPEWTMEFISDGCLDLSGYRSDELVGNQNRSYASLIHPEDRAMVWESVQKDVAERKPFQMTYRIITAEGKEKWVWEKGEGVFDASGTLIALEGFITDISERVGYEKNLQLRMEQLDALSQACQIVTASLDLDRVLQEIIALAKRLTQADYGGIVLVDEAGHVGQHAEDHVGYSSLRYNLRPDGITHWVLRNQKIAIGDSVSTDGSIEPPLGDGAPRTVNPALIATKIRSFISLPLIIKGQTRGVLHLYSKSPSTFRQSKALLIAFASQAAIAIDNAYQFQAAQQRLERLVSMRQIDQAINSSLDLPLTLDILIGHVLTQLKVDAAAVLLYRSETQSLHFVAGQGFRTTALQHSEIRLGQGFAGVAALERRIVSITDREELIKVFARSPHFEDEGFQVYLGVPLIAKGSVIGVLEIYNRQLLDPSPEWMAFLEALAGQAAIAIENTRLFNDLQNTNLQLLQAYDATIEGWAKALEFRDTETEGHSRRVVELTLKLARRLGVEDQQLTVIRRGVLLHDIGKMAIPDSLLQKAGPLNEDEWKLMRQHPLFARQMLENIPFLHTALDIPYCHHEKWDGSGYPRGLKGDQVPLAARIFTVVDVWDALTNDRPYRKAWSKKQALASLTEQKGKHFDPNIVDAFLAIL
ncbi:MAG: HD domain-containing phosphohydrolase, partial [Anaerolineales bacterium]